MKIQTENGYPEVVLMSGCERALFYTTANWLLQKLNICFSKKDEHCERIDWHFQFAGDTALLRYQPQGGISLCPAALKNTTIEQAGAFKKLIETLQYNPNA